MTRRKNPLPYLRERRISRDIAHIGIVTKRERLRSNKKSPLSRRTSPRGWTLHHIGGGERGIKRTNAIS